MQKMEKRPNLLLSAPLTEGGYATPDERTPQAIADNVSEIAANGALPAKGVNGTAEKHHSAKEGPMQPKLPTDASSLEQRKQSLRRTQSLSRKG